MSSDRERAVTAAFVALARSLADGVDPVDLLIGLAQDTTRLLDVASTGILLADPRGVLHIVAASSEATRTLEVFQLQRDQGPCLDCYHSGAPVSVADLRAAAARWPLFVEAATEAGFASVHAVPLRLRDNMLGTMGLFGAHVGALNDDDVDLGQALAYVAAVAIVQDKVSADQAAVNEQLQVALNSRVVLEQAKGVLAQRGNLDMDRSFAALRRYARDHNLRLTDVASAVAGLELPAQQVLGHAAAGDPEQLSVTLERSPEGISLRLAGEMDIATADRLVEMARTLPDQDLRHLRLDLAELHFIDASGLNALMQTRTHVLDHGGRLTLHGVRSLLHRLLAITDLSGAFELAPALATPTDRSPPGQASSPPTG